MNKLSTYAGVTLLELTVVLLVLSALAELVVPYMGGTSSKALCDATDLSMQNIRKAIMGGGSGAAFYLDTLGYFPKDQKTGTNYTLKYLMDKPLDSANGGWDAYDPETAVGWRGPYLMSATTLDAKYIDGDTSNGELAPNLKDTGTYKHTAFLADDSIVNDGWGRPIVLQVPTVSDCQNNIIPSSPSKEGYCARLVSAGSGSGLGIGEANIETTLASKRPVASAHTLGSDDRILYLNAPTPASDINPSCDQ